MRNKQINIQLRADIEKERQAIEFLEGKPNKYIILEALELYRTRYEGMKSGEIESEKPTAAKSEQIEEIAEKQEVTPSSSRAMSFKDAINKQ